MGITAKQRTLLELFKKHNEDARKLVGISKTPATLAKYDRCYRRLEEFMKVKYNISDISLKEIAVDYEILRANPLEDMEYEKKPAPKHRHASSKSTLCC